MNACCTCSLSGNWKTEVVKAFKSNCNCVFLIYQRSRDFHLQDQLVISLLKVCEILACTDERVLGHSPQCSGSVQECRHAGGFCVLGKDFYWRLHKQVIMVTGNHPITAQAISKQVCISCYSSLVHQLYVHSFSISRLCYGEEGERREGEEGEQPLEWTPTAGIHPKYAMWAGLKGE